MTGGFKNQLILATVKLLLLKSFDLEADYHSSLWRRLIFIAWSHVMFTSSIGFLFLSVSKERAFGVETYNSEGKLKCTWQRCFQNRRHMHLFSLTF